MFKGHVDLTSFETLVSVIFRSKLSLLEEIVGLQQAFDRLEKRYDYLVDQLDVEEMNELLEFIKKTERSKQDG